MAPSGLVLVNGSESSVQAPRARALFGDEAAIVYKKQGRLGSVHSIWRSLNSFEGDWVYCIDLGVPAAVLALLRRRMGGQFRLIYEIGDPTGDLIAHQGRPFWEREAARRIDRHLPLRADGLVFRGSYLATYFGRLCGKPLPPWIWAPDGVDCDRFRPQRNDPKVAALRRAHGLEGHFVVGVVGSLHRGGTHDLFYGWELAHALARLPASVPIKGVIVGDGPGRGALEQSIAQLGVGNRVLRIGHVPHEDVPYWLNTFDVALSTQTDDAVGWGRTTAKLPEYLASGCAVLCSDVGEAHRWLGQSGQTLPYTGVKDDSYPVRLAERLVSLMQVDLTDVRIANRLLALRLFHYPVIRRGVRQFLRRIGAGTHLPETASLASDGGCSPRCR